MQFRCPNCQHPIRVEDHADVTPEAETIDTIECPSCHSRFSLSSDEDSTATVSAGMKIAHFELQEVLGEGSFGTVYKAWDTELLRYVAIKVPREGRITKDTSRLFLREARAAAGISHPNVVSIYEMGQHAETFYIASELIDGISLSEYLRHHSLEPVESAKLMIKLLSGVKVFHEKGLIHRDLKPGNILLDMQNEPHIADFGLARNEDRSDITVTHSGQLVGTLLYMSPEQARGENKSLSIRSDIYALGVILYELLTGQKPFKSTSSRTLIYSILTDEPKRPSSLKKSTPRDLETICLKALEKDPDKRYLNAAEMADDLQRFLDHRPILARPISPPEQLWRLMKRHRLASLLGSLLIPAVAAVVFLMLKPEQIRVVEAEPITEYLEAPPIRYSARFSYILSGENIPPDVFADWVILPLEQRTREPIESEAIRISQKTNPELQLLPGEYLAVVNIPGFGFHEVYRYVPADPQATITGPYPHERWSVSADGVIVLPPIQVRRLSLIQRTMVSIPRGQFEMGDGIGNRPKHTQTVEAFWVDPAEVSADDFEQFIPLGAHYSEPKGKYPVCVHWDSATAFAEFSGKRLLRETEFEYLARDLGRSSFPSGSTPVIRPEELWPYLEAGQPDTDRMSSLPVFGLHSNVAEWTDSLDNMYPGMPPISVELEKKMNKLRNRIIRGGPFKVGLNDRQLNKWGESVSFRRAIEMTTADSEVGFRCALSGGPSFQMATPNQ